MKNLLPIFLLSFILHTSTHAQITLTQTSYPSLLVGTDSLKKSTYNSSFPSLAAITVGLWDMNVVTDTTPVFYSYRVAAAGYQYADSNTYKFSYISYKGNSLTNITAAGILEYGTNIGGNAYGLGAITSDPMDSLTVPNQNILYSNPRIKLSFPTNSSSYWASSYSSDLNFQISLSFLGLSHATGIARSYYLERDSVTGWGKMSVKDAIGNPSSYFNVLQVQTIISKTDSFFINGVPATAIQLGSLGLTQGKKDTTYLQNYYREQEVTPLAQIKFKNSSYIQPVSSTTHVQRLQQAAVPMVIGSEKVVVFPNPVANNTVNLQLPTSGDWTYVLTDMGGKIVLSRRFSAIGGKSQIILPPAIAEGTFNLKLVNRENGVFIQQINVVR
jgi:hypothetical protein